MRRQYEMLHAGGGGSNVILARGKPMAGTADCATGTVQIDTNLEPDKDGNPQWAMTGGCGSVPDADSYGIITVYDPQRWFSKQAGVEPRYSELRIESALWLNINYKYELDAYGECVGQWELEWPNIRPDCSTES